jgi:hypothetical protein
VLIAPEDLLPVAQEAVDLAVKVLHDAHGYGQRTPKGDRDYPSQLDFDVEHHMTLAVNASGTTVTEVFGSARSWPAQ